MIQQRPISCLASDCLPNSSTTLANEALELAITRNAVPLGRSPPNFVP